MAAAAVPSDGPARLGPVQLSAGRQLFGWNDDVPRLWASSEPVPDAGRLWQKLADQHPETGLVPITLAFLEGGHAGRPWDEGEFEDRNDLASVDGVDAASVLAENWDLKVPVDPDERDGEAAEMIAPFGWDFPGLARGQDQALSDRELERALGWFKLARIGLVPASRPADVLAVIGLNDVNRDADPALLAAVLRSWEDRFGAVLVEVGFAHIRLLARRQPRTPRDVQAVAAELWAMCDEFWPVDRPGRALWGVDEIAEHITDNPIWSIWLD